MTSGLLTSEVLRTDFEIFSIYPFAKSWIPMEPVIPAEAGIQKFEDVLDPAFAGVALWQPFARPS